MFLIRPKRTRAEIRLLGTLGDAWCEFGALQKDVVKRVQDGQDFERGEIKIEVRITYARKPSAKKLREVVAHYRRTEIIGRPSGTSTEYLVCNGPQ